MPSLADRLADRVASLRPGPKSFFDRLAPEAQAEMIEVRRRWQSGELPTSASALADLLIEEAAASGYDLCGPQGLRVWLARRD